MTSFLPWLNHISYAACLYLVARICLGDVRRVADALALNWAVGLLIWAAGSGKVVLPAYILIDFLTALWLLGVVRTGLARLIGLIFVPAILTNGGLYIGKDILGLSGLSLNTWSWLQMSALLGGAWGDGLGKMVDRLTDSLRGGRAVNARFSPERKGTAR